MSISLLTDSTYTSEVHTAAGARRY